MVSSCAKWESSYSADRPDPARRVEQAPFPVGTDIAGAHPDVRARSSSRYSATRRTPRPPCSSGRRHRNSACDHCNRAPTFKSEAQTVQRTSPASHRKPHHLQIMTRLLAKAMDTSGDFSQLNLAFASAAGE